MPAPRFIKPALLAGFLATIVPAQALATYSIVATDTTTKQVGGAGTSCVGAALSVYVIYGSVPGRGVVAAQAQINYAGRDAAVMRLAQNQSPASIIAAITATGFDRSAASRQYGIVDVTGQSAGHTGQSNQNFADDRQGQAGGFAYSVQGNILTSAAVLEQAAAAFTTSGCDLADKLMLALEAGGRNGQGDSRCTRIGIPSDGAFIQVDLPTGAAGSYLKLTVDNTRPQNPLTRLRQQYDTWRQTHPCGARDAGADGAAGAAGSAGGGGVDGSAGGAGASGTGAGNAGSAGSAAAGSGGAGDAAGGAAQGGSAGRGTAGRASAGQGGTAAPGSDSDSDSGCSCRTASGNTANALGIGLLTGGFAALGLGRRRRQKALYSR